MQGQQIYHPVSTVINMESLIPSHHFLKKVDQVIDLSFIRGLTKAFYSEGKGRPSIDPELFFRIILVGYFYNIKSDRQLCEEIHYNLAYRWFCKISFNKEVPHHSSLSRIRDRLGEPIFEQFFQKIVRLCQERGLVKGKHLMTDATLIEANASIESMILKDEQADKETFKSKGLGPPKSQKISNKTHQSITDPDASLAFKEGTPRSLKYKNHITLDSENRIIVDTHISTGADHESQEYVKRLEYIQSTFNWTIEDATADRAYGTGDNLQNLKDKSIKTYIPLFNGRSGTALKEGFIYDTEQDHFLCPEGKILVQRGTNADEAKYYRACIQDCGPCSLKQNCLTSPDMHKYGKVLKIGKYQHIYNEVSIEMKTPGFIKKLAERFWKIEGIMAEAKNCHTLKRARYRSRPKVQIQAYLVSIVQNIKRLIGLATDNPKDIVILTIRLCCLSNNNLNKILCP